MLIILRQKARKEESQRLIEKTIKSCRDEAAAQTQEELKLLYNLLTDNGARSRTMKKSSTTLALTVAAAKGYVNVLRKLVDEGADISAKCGEHNETALHFAARAGKTQVVAFLLERGANIERPDGQSRVPLHCAAWNGHEETTQFLLDKGAAVDAQDGGGRTALYGAAAIGNLAVVQMLLKRAADPTISGGTLQETPLAIARKKGHAAIVQELSKNDIQMGLGQTGSGDGNFAQKELAQKNIVEDGFSQNMPMDSPTQSK
jgi:ankyrin repeat protein